MDRRSSLAESFAGRLGYPATSCQSNLFRGIADFVTDDEGDILVVNGYAGTGKTTAIAAVVETMSEMAVPCVLLAPTGRAAKVLSSYTRRQAYTIHKHIYRQKSVSDEGFARFSLSPNRARDTLYIVDEVSLIGVESGQSTVNFGTGNLLEDLINFVRAGSGSKLIMIGDSAQLPPLGLDRSPALSEEYMSMAGGVRFVTLSSVVRQQKESGILKNATILRKFISGDFSGVISPSQLHLSVEGFDDIERVSGAELIDCITDAYSSYGEDGTVVLCRSNKKANRYNNGIRAQVLYREEQLVRDDKLMIVKNCYQFVDQVEGLDYIANGDIARLIRISDFEERYGLHFAEAVLSFPDYGDVEIKAKVCMDTLESEAASLTEEQQNRLYQGVMADYGSISSKKRRNEAAREDPFFNALQLKYAEAITCHKSQGGQWSCVFIDNPFWQDVLSLDDVKWLYTAITRGVEKVYFINFKDSFFV